MSSNSREVITLQLGHFSNYVGTHLWNIQESTFSYTPNPSAEASEIENDVLYREGRTLLGEVTYTPRLISVDLKGSLNTLKPQGVLYDIDCDACNPSWSGDVTLHQTTPALKNPFLADLDSAEAMQVSGTAVNDLPTPDKEEDLSGQASAMPTTMKNKVYHLDRNVQVWSDFLYGHLHPRTQVVVMEYLHNSDTETFDMFSQGRDLLNNKQTAEDIEDRLHFFVEECDHLQGFQIIADFCDGFSGLSSGVAEMLHDDYKGKGILTWGVAPSSFSRQTSILDSFRVINSVLSFDQLTQHSSLFTPISLLSTLWRKAAKPYSFQNMLYKPELWYHSSAIMASTIDTATLPWRIIDQPLPLGQLCDLFSQSGRKIATLCSSFPFPLHEDSTLASLLCEHQEAAPWQPLASHVGAFNKEAPFVQSVVLRGIPESKLKSPTPKFHGSLEITRTVDEMTKLYLASVYPQTMSSCLTLKQASQTSTPYPHVFAPCVSREGFLTEIARCPDQAVSSAPMMTSLQSSPLTRGMLKTLILEAKKIDLRKFHGYTESNLEQEEFETCVDNLEELANAFEKEFGSVESMSDDD